MYLVWYLKCVPVLVHKNILFVFNKFKTAVQCLHYFGTIMFIWSQYWTVRGWINSMALVQTNWHYNNEVMNHVTNPDSQLAGRMLRWSASWDCYNVSDKSLPFLWDCCWRHLTAYLAFTVSYWGNNGGYCSQNAIILPIEMLHQFNTTVYDWY